MEEVIIIGTGCAGYTAAIYVARANLKPLMLSGTQPGGQLTTTTEVENFPGHPDGIMGPDLMMRMQTQAEKFGSRIAYEMVESVTRRDDGTFAVKTGSETHEAKTVIIATGAAPRHLGLPNEKSLIGRGLTSCATCDGAFYRNVPVCVIPPNSFALARTVEYFKIPRDVLVICLGKSTYARCGIIVNVTPLEPEWEGHVTLEFSNTTTLPAKISR